jgi:hypothetical protein
LNDSVRNAVSGGWVVTGFNGEVVDLSRTKRDQTSIVKLSKEGAKMTPMVSPIDIAGALENVRNLLAELENDMPELSLHRMREGQTPSGVAVHMLWGDASDRIQEAASNYDEAVARAQAMGIAMGAYHGYQGYKGFKVTDYEAGNLTHTIKARSMFDETLDKQSRLNTYAMLSSQPPEIQRLMLQELDVDEATIDKIVSAAEEQDARDMEMAARGTLSTLNGGDDDKEPTREEMAKKQAAGIQKKNMSATNSG